MSSMRAPCEDEEEETLSERASRPRVLVVDDNSEMRRVVLDTLRHEGYEVREAASARMLLDMILRIETSAFPLDGIDLILLDHRMPGMTGLDAIRVLRQAEKLVPAILMTAYPEGRLEVDAASLDVTVLPKPFTRADLRRAVQVKLGVPFSVRPKRA